MNYLFEIGKNPSIADIRYKDGVALKYGSNSNSNLIVGLDIGTSKVVCIVGKYNDKHELNGCLGFISF